MQIVIDIPEELISEIDDENYQGIISWYDTALYCAIKDGTPLPKGHGRLIDADKLKQKIEMADEDIMEEDWYKLYDNVISDIDNAHPIIEADAESEDKE